MIRQRWFAAIYRLIDRPLRRATDDARRALVGDLRGEVVEVGCGTGATFPRYAASAHVLAVDANPHMLAAARTAARDAVARIKVRSADAVALPCADASMDAYVATLVLCSVSDLDAVLREAFRVLRPGGALRLFEHVAASSTLGRVTQRAANPAWTRIADGCHLDRDPVTAAQRAGFHIIAVDAVSAPVLPMVLVRAVKPRGDGQVDAG